MRCRVDRAAVGCDVDPGEHGVQDRQRKRGQEYRQNGREDDLRGKGPAHTRLVMGADAARGDDAEACRHAEGKLQKDVYNRGNVVDAREDKGSLKFLEQQRERTIDAGLSVKQTARQLGISPRTVENTQRVLYRKLAVRNRAQAVATAYRLGLLPGDDA